MLDLKITVDNAKSEPHYDLEKLPDDILLKYANIEIGQLKSYIEELEEQLNVSNPVQNVDKSEIERLEAENKALRKENKSLRKRKGDGAADVKIVLPDEEKLKLRELMYRNDLVLITKRERDAFKAARDRLRGENETLVYKNLRLSMQLVELQRSMNEILEK